LERILIENGIVVPMNPKREILRGASILIEGDKIAGIGSEAELKGQKPDITIDAREKIVIPGLIDLHFHSDNAAKGIGEHLNLEDFVNNYYYPVLAAASSEDVYRAALLAYSEALLSGTTVVNDMYIKLADCARAAEKLGIRSVLSSTATDMLKGLESLEDNERAFRTIRSPSGRVKVWMGVEWLPISSDEFLFKAREFADKYKTGIHVHLNESRNEVEMCVKDFGKRPTVRAHDCGITGPDVVAAHCVWLSEEEKKIYADTGTHVSHNPISNAKLGNGVSPAPELMAMGVNVGLGIDAPICNNTTDMFETMKFASLVHKARFTDASQMPALKIMEMATLNGARALGMRGELGSLEVGKKADVVLIDLNVPNMRPVHFGDYANIYQNLVYSSPGNAVDTVLVDGKIVVENKRLKTMDLKEIISGHSRMSEILIERRKDYLGQYC